MALLVNGLELSRNVTYLRVSFVLQVEHEKQLTHQALFRADTTEGSHEKHRK